MGVVLTRCFVDLCGGDPCEGFALIKFVPPTGYNGVIVDLITRKAYANNTVIKAPIDPNTGCWESCELPFSDQLSPKCHYEVAEVIKGDSLDNCICDDGCNCFKFIEPTIPVAKLWLSSFAGLPATVNMNDIASNTDVPELCEYLSGVYGDCIPTTYGIQLSTTHFTESVATPLNPWYAHANGYVDLDFAAVQLGADLHDQALNYEIINQDGDILYDGSMPAGTNVQNLSTLGMITVSQGDWLSVRIATPIPPTTPGALFIQGRFLAIS